MGMAFGPARELRLGVNLLVVKAACSVACLEWLGWIPQPPFAEDHRRGGAGDETLAAKEARDTIMLWRKTPRLSKHHGGLKYGLSGDLAPQAETRRAAP